MVYKWVRGPSNNHISKYNQTPIGNNSTMQSGAVLNAKMASRQ